MAMEVKWKRVESEAVPGQLASGQTLRFGPFRFCGVVTTERSQIYKIVLSFQKDVF